MRFTVRTAADAQALSRVLEHFALRMLLPERVEAVRNGEVVDISLEMDRLDETTARLIVGKIRSSVLVLDAALSVQSARYFDGVTS
ncbi:MAG: hypothetical protein U1E68_06705 [Sphingomonadaceae bacterium]|jgi:hypothetical protein